MRSVAMRSRAPKSRATIPITLKRSAILICVLSLVAGSTYFTRGFQLKRLARSVDRQAECALEKGDIEKAANLYGEHVVVLPEDVEAQIKYADTLLKGTPAPRERTLAQILYSEILNQYPGRDDVRRRRAELFATVNDGSPKADLEILLKLPKYKNDANLMFLFAKALESNHDEAQARKWYEDAIKNNAPQKIDAYQRLASLLRDPNGHNNPKAADKKIDEMIKSSPKDYKAYLARARYRHRFGLPGAKADSEKALNLAGDQPEVFLEMAKIAETEVGKKVPAAQEEARKILAAGLKKIPTSTDLVQALADLELRARRLDAAVETLERGIKSADNKAPLHFALAHVLATRGDTGKLLVEIEEVKKAGFHSQIVQLLMGNYYVNHSQYKQGLRALAPLQSTPAGPRSTKRGSTHC